MKEGFTPAVINMAENCEASSRPFVQGSCIGHSLEGSIHCTGGRSISHVIVSLEAAMNTRVRFHPVNFEEVEDVEKDRAAWYVLWEGKRELVWAREICGPNYCCSRANVLGQHKKRDEVWSVYGINSPSCVAYFQCRALTQLYTESRHHENTLVGVLPSGMQTVAEVWNNLIR